MCKSLVEIPYQDLGFVNLTLLKSDSRFTPFRTDESILSITVGKNILLTELLAIALFPMNLTLFLEIALSDVSQYQQGSRLKSLPWPPHEQPSSSGTPAVPDENGTKLGHVPLIY